MTITIEQLKQVIEEEINLVLEERSTKKSIAESDTKYAMIGLLYVGSIDDSPESSSMREAAHWLDNFLGKGERPPAHLAKNLKATYRLIDNILESEPGKFKRLAAYGREWKVELYDINRTTTLQGAAPGKSTSEDSAEYKWTRRAESAAQERYITRRDNEGPYVIIYNGNPAVHLDKITGDLQHKYTIASDLLKQWKEENNIEGNPLIRRSPSNRSIMQMIIPGREGDFD